MPTAHKRNPVIETIVSDDPEIRNRTAEELLDNRPSEDLFRFAADLDNFRESAENLYHRVRACLFIFAIYRFYLAGREEGTGISRVPPAAGRDLEAGRWREAAEKLRPRLSRRSSAAVLTALAEAYYHLAFEYLLDQVKDSIRSAPGNRWLFDLDSLKDYSPPPPTTPPSSTLP